MATNSVASFSYSLENKKVWVAGHNGMVGSALMRRLSLENCTILTANKSELDLCNQAVVNTWMADHRPDVVVIAAAKVGGIMANAENPAAFFYDNVMIATNIMHAAHAQSVERLLFLGSSCIYPRDCEQPMKEDALLTGALESTNEAYALAKITGLKMAQYYRTQYGSDFISAMPCNLYGIGDMYDAQNSHVIPAIIMKAHVAKMQGEDVLTLWGSGNPLREFMYVDELADILVMLLQKYSSAEPINVGTGDELTIKNLAKTICEVVGYHGKIEFDVTKPDGTPRKVLDNTKIITLSSKNQMCQKSGNNNDADKMKIYLAQCYQDFLGRDRDGNARRSV